MNNQISSLKNREIYFDKFIKDVPFSGYKLCPGLFIVDIPEEYFDNILNATRLFITKVSTKKSTIFKDYVLDELIRSEKFTKLECITPSGMILPKVYSSFEYNILMKAFYDLMRDMNLDIESWYSIMPLRFKASYKENYKPGIQYSHEPHLDSWTGFSNYAYCAFLPILGDLNNNYIEFWEPTNGIEENWIAGFKSQFERKEILKNFKKIDFKLKPGQLALADSYIVHNTAILNNAGPRIGIDNLFRPAWAEKNNHIENIYRTSDLRSHQEVCEIGLKSYYDFIDDDEIRRPSQGGLKSPVGYRFVELKI